MTVYTMNCTPILFNNCPERLCEGEGIGQTLRKDDSWESTLVLYMNYIYLYGFLPGLQLWRGRDDIGDMFKYGKQVINTHAYCQQYIHNICIWLSSYNINRYSHRCRELCSKRKGDKKANCKTLFWHRTSTHPMPRSSHIKLLFRKSENAKLSLYTAPLSQTHFQLHV